MNSVYFMTECQILWGTWQLQTFWICKAKNYLLTHITNKCCQMNPLNFSWSFTPGQRAWFLWKGKDIFGPNFQSLQFPIWNLICREKESSKWQWDGSKQMLWAMPCSWGMLWGQRSLLVLHHNGNALHCSGKLTDHYLHQYFLLKSKIQGAALIFLLIFMGTWPALPIIHTMVWLGLWYVTQHFKTETDNF